MATMIARLDHEACRVFPAISEDLYSGRETPSSLTSDQRLAACFLNLVELPLSRWQVLTGHGLDAAGKIGRLLRWHRQAIQAECSAHWRKADFYWREFYQGLRRLSKQDEVWSEVHRRIAPEAGLSLLDTSEKLRSRFIEEIVIDVHCAFYNGRVHLLSGGSPRDRAFEHVARIEELSDLAPLSGGGWLTLLGPPMELMTELFEEAGDWGQAIAACQRVLDRYPDAVSFQDRMANLIAMKTAAAMKDTGSDANYVGEAARLRRGITELLRLREAYFENVTIYRLLAQLYHLRAVRLANAGLVSDALVDARKAQFFDPELEDVQGTFDKLVEMMQDLQKRIAAVRMDMANRPNTVLSEQGQALARQAKAGFDPVNEFTESDEAKEIADDFQDARACRIWHRIGLEPPPDRWGERARSLVAALSSVIASAAHDREAISDAWAKAADGNPELESLAREPICQFLESSILGGQREAEASTPVMEPVHPPVLTPASETPKGEDEPVLEWLFSGQGRPLKALAAVTILLLVLSTTAAIERPLTERRWDAAYLQVMEAVRTGNAPAVVDAAERFLSNRFPGVRDTREQAVLAYYEEAIVRSVAQSPGSLDADTRDHLQRYRSLTRNVSLEEEGE